MRRQINSGLAKTQKCICLISVYPLPHHLFCKVICHKSLREEYLNYKVGIPNNLQGAKMHLTLFWCTGAKIIRLEFQIIPNNYLF